MKLAAPTHIGFLDSVRGFAILLVFFLHATAGYVLPPAPMGEQLTAAISEPTLVLAFLFKLGHFGVAVFFVVSGFCIHLSFRRNPGWGGFFIKRFFRIYPPYLMALLFFAFIFPWSPGLPLDGKTFLKHLFLVNNFREGEGLAINPSFWSVAVEAQLYLLYPLLFLAGRRYGWNAVLILTALIEISMRVAITTHGGGLYGWAMSPFVYWFSWAVGAYVCECHVDDRTNFMERHSVIAWSLAAVFTDAIPVLAQFAFPCAAIASAAFIAKKLKNRISLPIPAWIDGRIARIGVYSYGIYLFHQPLFRIAELLQVQTTPRVNSRLAYLSIPELSEKFVTFGYCMGLGIATYYFCQWFFRFVEKPCMAMGNRIARGIRLEAATNS